MHHNGSQTFGVCYIISVKLLKHNPWRCWEGASEGDGERVAQEEKWLIPERGSTAIDLSSQI